MLPGIKTERPKENDPRVSEVFADILVKNIFINTPHPDALAIGIHSWHQYIFNGEDNGAFSLLNTLEESEHLSEEEMTYQVVYNLSYNFNKFKKGAYDAVVREWVIAEGIRFNAKEGDAIEFLDPDGSYPRVGAVLAVEKGLASALVQWRGAGDKLVRAYVPAERVVKVYKDGKPFDNNPRGGKIGFSTAEFTEALAA